MNLHTFIFFAIFFLIGAFAEKHFGIVGRVMPE